jgi:hypothetical protein
MLRTPLPRLFSLIAVLVFAGVSRAGDDKDNWFIVEMLGQRAGWMHSTTATKGDQVTSTSKMHLAIKRGETVIKVSMDSLFVETAAGKPISMAAVESLSATPTVKTYTFQEDGTIELVTEQNGQQSKETFAKPDGVWLAPAAADRYVIERFKSGAKEIKVRSIDPLSGPKPVSVTRSGFEKATITLEGRKLDVTKVKSTNSVAPLVSSTEYLDENGEAVRTDTNLGILALKILATTREKALADSPAPELMVNTFVKPDKPIHEPRDAKKLVLVASVPDGELPELPNTGSQKVETLTPTSATVTITSRGAAKAAPAPEADSNNGQYLKATAMANIDDPKVKELAKQAVEKAGNDPAARAEACRRFVYRYIKKKNLDVGFASASEVARNKEGDCSEHGVLLTALLRANGIPARAATGLIYVDDFEGSQGIFGYHMWAQALLTVDGKARWVDLDGTLPNSMPFDATHITLATTDLADGESISGLAAIAPLMGRLQIKVQSAE